VKIVLTRESGYNGALRTFTPPSALVYEVPLTTTIYRPLTEVESELEGSGYFRAFWSLVVTSARSGDYVESAMRALHKGAAVFSVGRATTRLLVSHDIVVTGESELTALDLAPFVRRGPVLQLGALAVRDELSRALADRGLVVYHVACYETVAMELTTLQRETLASADVIFIGAPSAWDVARDYVSPEAWVVVPGPTTGEKVRASHEQVLEGWEPAIRDVLATLDV
jgi:uroporphyrinogen-III synthase